MRLQWIHADIWCVGIMLPINHRADTDRETDNYLQLPAIQRVWCQDEILEKTVEKLLSSDGDVTAEQSWKQKGKKITLNYMVIWTNCRHRDWRINHLHEVDTRWLFTDSFLWTFTAQSAGKYTNNHSSVSQSRTYTYTGSGQQWPCHIDSWSIRTSAYAGCEFILMLSMISCFNYDAKNSRQKHKLSESRKFNHKIFNTDPSDK